MIFEIANFNVHYLKIRAYSFEYNGEKNYAMLRVYCYERVDYITITDSSYVRDVINEFMEENPDYFSDKNMEFYCYVCNLYWGSSRPQEFATFYKK